LSLPCSHLPSLSSFTPNNTLRRPSCCSESRGPLARRQLPQVRELERDCIVLSFSHPFFFNCSRSLSPLSSISIKNKGGASAPAGSDIVLDSFREQQKQIRELMEGMKVRREFRVPGRTKEEGGERERGGKRRRRRRSTEQTPTFDPDPPLSLSLSLKKKKKNSKTQQSIPVPLSGDPAAVKKFAADVEALKRKAGVPDEAELEAALVSFRLKASGGDVRKALAALTADDSDLDAALSAALEQAEKESGGALTDANAKGWALLASKVQALAKARGLDDVAKVKSEATVKMYAEALKSLRDGAADAVSAAARRDGLEGVVSVDAAALKPKW